MQIRIITNVKAWYHRRATELSTSAVPTVAEFCRALFFNWLAAMSGAPSVPLSIAAVYVDGTLTKVLLWISAFFCVWCSAYCVWKSERKSARKLQENLSDAKAELSHRHEEIEASKDQTRAIQAHTEEISRQFVLVQAERMNDAEKARRQRIYSNICKKYMLILGSTGGFSRDMAAGLEPPPVQFVNDELRELGELWQVPDNKNG